VTGGIRLVAFSFAFALGLGCEAPAGAPEEARRAVEAPVQASAVPGDLLSPAPPPAASEAQPADEPPTFLDAPTGPILEAMATRRPVGARGTSGQSLSMRLDLEGPIDVAFKPNTHSGQRWSGEVAAYRLGLLLGLHTVPPAATRRFRYPVLESLLTDDPETLAEVHENAIVSSDNTVVGAVMYWVPAIYPAEVDRLEELERWTAWLRQGASIPPEQLSLAQQLSDLIVFDAVTGNWDRWSGDNLLFGPDHQTLLAMDNNGAFNAELSPRLQERLEAPLLQIERFSAALYWRLRGLTAESIRAELARDPEGGGVLNQAQIDAVLVRRDRVVARIEALEREHGHDAVLCFP
jgi:hypothetical protein